MVASLFRYVCFYMEKEEWKSIDGYPHWKVSNFGTIVGPSGKILKPLNNGMGYFSVALSGHKYQKKFYIHRIVGFHFVPEFRHGLEINHKDGNKANNHYLNLEWVSHSGNVHHANKNGLTNILRGEKRSLKLKDDDVRCIRRDYVPFKNSLSMVAKKYKVSRAAIREIVCGRSWKHLL